MFVQAAAAEPVVLTGGGWDTVSPAPPRPYDPAIHRPLFVNEFSVDVTPNQPPLSYSFPITEMPTEVRYGLGNWTAPIDRNPFWSLGPNKRILDWQPESIEVRLNYWYYSPIGTAWNVGWSIHGTGTVVPEPSALALLLPLGWLFTRRTKRS
jgi:hypothetical protein